ncbi:hypothetical protein [Amycolatopsis sp. lyj-84]|uniref:hypothetical protein n=1 Tax=Amycolatopsis sp. lyj-84 TaxID=2789284 RepID=UPI00397A7451
MGAWAFDYVHVSPRESGDEALAVVREMATHALGARGSAEYFEMRGEHHWIDLEVFNSADGARGRAQVSMRLALCNPPGLERELRKLIAGLLERCGGRIFTMQPRDRFTDIEGDGWERLWARFTDKQAWFREGYGHFDAAISVDDLSSYMREHAIFPRSEAPRFAYLLEEKILRDSQGHA